MPKDQGCLFRAILRQVYYPKGYTIDMFRRQVVYYMAKHCEFFSHRAKLILQELNLSYQAYLLGIASGEIWGDSVILLAISIMFNISITVLSPLYLEP